MEDSSPSTSTTNHAGADQTSSVAELPASAGPVNKDEPIPQLVWLVFGATGHFGRTVVGVALSKNDLVIAVGKSGVDEGSTANPSHENLVSTVCDVRHRDSVANVIEEAIKVWGRLDIIVNCAGYGVIGAIEDQDEYEIRNQMDTNFMGVFHIVHCSVPYFRERKEGRYIIFSSTSGFLGLPGLGGMMKGFYNLDINLVTSLTDLKGYCASKWAVEGFIESLMYELEPFNIKVSLVISGLAKRDEPSQAVAGPLPNWGHFLMINPSPPYSSVTSPANHARRMVQWIRDKQITSGVKVAEMVWELAHCQSPPLRLFLGQHAVESMRDRLRFTLEEIEDWKHLYHLGDEDNLNDGFESNDGGDVVMSNREEDDDSK